MFGNHIGISALCFIYNCLACLYLAHRPYISKAFLVINVFIILTTVLSPPYYVLGAHTGVNDLHFYVFFTTV